MNCITRIDNGDLLYKPLWYHEQGVQQTASGYGSKLTTAYKTEYKGRLYRVYCIIWSNLGSLYIISKGQRLYIMNECVS
jgi:hypothetical protein